MEYMQTTNSWVSVVSREGVFECPSSLDCSRIDDSHVLPTWTIIRTDDPKSIISPTSGSTEEYYTVSPSATYVPVITVSTSLTLYVNTLNSESVAYSEVVLDVASGATVTADTNLTLVDEITAGKRNICVVRWSNGVAKLYVTIVEDLPQA